MKKVKILDKLDEEILELTPEDKLETEIEQSDLIKARIEVAFNEIKEALGELNVLLVELSAYISAWMSTPGFVKAYRYPMVLCDDKGNWTPRGC